LNEHAHQRPVFQSPYMFQQHFIPAIYRRQHSVSDNDVDSNPLLSRLFRLVSKALSYDRRRPSHLYLPVPDRRLIDGKRRFTVFISQNYVNKAYQSIVELLSPKPTEIRLINPSPWRDMFLQCHRGLQSAPLVRWPPQYMHTLKWRDLRQLLPRNRLRLCRSKYPAIVSLLSTRKYCSLTSGL
jgi:hypothetical protein